MQTNYYLRAQTPLQNLRALRAQIIRKAESKQEHLHKIPRNNLQARYFLSIFPFLLSVMQSTSTNNMLTTLLDHDFVSKILSYLGSHYLYVAPVCRRFHSIYLNFLSIFPFLPSVMQSTSTNNMLVTLLDHDCVSTILSYLGGHYLYVAPVCRRFYRIYQREHHGEGRTLISNSIQNTNCMKWALSRGYGWRYKICNYAAKKGNLEVLQWARSEGCDWNKNDCLRVARQYRNVSNWINAQEA